MWICHQCKRKFKNANQNHSCVLVSKDDLFAKRPKFLRDLCDEIISSVKELEEFREEAILPDVIFFKTKSTFLAIKLKKDHLEIEFFLDHHEDDPSIAKWLQTSKYRFAHVVRVDNEEDITTQLTEWIKQSYHLTLS
jgi:hypothetical protein